MSKPFGKAIKQTTYIDVPIEKVFETITSPSGWDAFFTTGMELDLKPGGDMLWSWKNWGPDCYNGRAIAKVLEVSSPNQFSFEWYPFSKDHPTTITFKLAKRGSGTVVIVTEDGYMDTERDREMILECACGWAEAVTLLKFYLEHGVVYTQPKRS